MNICTLFCAKNGFASAPSNIAIQYKEPEAVEAFGLDNLISFTFNVLSIWIAAVSQFHVPLGSQCSPSLRGEMVFALLSPRRHGEH